MRSPSISEGLVRCLGLLGRDLRLSLGLIGLNDLLGLASVGSILELVVISLSNLLILNSHLL